MTVSLGCKLNLINASCMIFTRQTLMDKYVKRDDTKEGIKIGFSKRIGALWREKAIIKQFQIMFWEMPHDDKGRKPMKWDSGQSALQRILPGVQLVHWLLKVLHNTDTQRKIPSIPGKIPKTEIDFCNSNDKDKSTIYFCSKKVPMFTRKNREKNILIG